MNDQFPELRTLLMNPPSWDVWNQLILLLDTWQEPASQALALDYTREHLDNSWPLHWRQANASWPKHSHGWELSRIETRELRVSPSDTMVFCPSTTFLMGPEDGSNSEIPGIHSDSTLNHLSRSFWCLTTLVTQSLWERVMGTLRVSIEHPRLPMTSVSMFDALRFCNELSSKEGLTPVYRFENWVQGVGEYNEERGKLSWDLGANGYRLPTEAEWEWACRCGGTAEHYSTLDEIAWTHENSSALQPVTLKKPNLWGLYDMLGNADEWVFGEDGLPLPESMTTDIDSDMFVDNICILRGGSFESALSYVSAYAREFERPFLTHNDTGFRVVRNA